MAEANISVDQDQFKCPVCLDLLKDPVTIPCGHSYCMSCITDCWNQEDQKRIYRCPLCKQSFTPRPVLGKNAVLAEMVEKLKKTRLQSAPAVPHTGSGEVQCDSCTGNKQKAVKSCLECRSSYCQNHLEQHESLFRGKGHNLMDATVPPPAPAVPHTGSGDVQCDSCTGNKQKAVKSCLECRSSYCQNHLEQHESLFRGKGHNLMDATVPPPAPAVPHTGSGDVQCDSCTGNKQKAVKSCLECRSSYCQNHLEQHESLFRGKGHNLMDATVPPPAPAVPHTGSGDVQCDSCTGNKQKAVKSCLECRSSYCQNHLEHHESLFRGKGHNMMDATARLQEIICPQHDKMMEIYCRTDQRCICMLCLMDEHKNHDTVSSAAARTEKQRDLEEMQTEYQQTIQKNEKDIQELREAVASYKRCAERAVEDNERIFTELIRSIERRRSEVTQLIRDQERAAVSRAEEQLERLEQEINDLRRRDAELKQLSQTQDHVHFLHTIKNFKLFQLKKSLSSVSLYGSTDGFSVRSHLSFDDVVKSVSQLRHKLQQFCSKETEEIPGRVKTIQVILAPDYQTREEFQQYFHEFTLDPNTVHSNIYLSEENTKMTSTNNQYNYNNHPDRFYYWFQALCGESVTGCCYWEIGWGGDGVDVSVAYKSINRKVQNHESRFGCNNHSWRLYCSKSSCSFWHNNIETELPVVSSRKIGVYVDHSAGILSFYSVSDTMSLIHRVQTTFTQPLYPGIGLGYHSAAKLYKKK